MTTNLASGLPWIGVRLRDGRRRRLDLLELFEHADDVDRVDTGWTVGDLAVFRLSTAILCAAGDAEALTAAAEHAAAGRTARLGDVAGPYLRERLDRFDLTGDRPFAQHPGLSVDPAIMSNMAAVDMRLARGSGRLVLDHTHDHDRPPYAPADLALTLTALQTCDIGGLRPGAWPAGADGPLRAKQSCQNAPYAGLLCVVPAIGRLSFDLAASAAAMRRAADAFAADAPTWDGPLPGCGPAVVDRCDADGYVGVGPMQLATLNARRVALHWHDGKAVAARVSAGCSVSVAGPAHAQDQQRALAAVDPLAALDPETGLRVTARWRSNLSSTSLAFCAVAPSAALTLAVELIGGPVRARLMGQARDPKKVLTVRDDTVLYRPEMDAARDAAAADERVPPHLRDAAATAAAVADDAERGRFPKPLRAGVKPKEAAAKLRTKADKAAKKVAKAAADQRKRLPKLADELTAVGAEHAPGSGGEFAALAVRRHDPSTPEQLAALTADIRKGH